MDIYLEHMTKFISCYTLYDRKPSQPNVQQKRYNSIDQVIEEVKSKRGWFSAKNVDLHVLPSISDDEYKKLDRYNGRNGKNLLKILREQLTA
jgi:hypothetical protein